MEIVSENLARKQWIIIITAVMGAMLPLVLLRESFEKLFWFGDEWYLLQGLLDDGLTNWSTQVFAENFVPLFKFFWGGAVWLVDGSYFVMIVLLWMTHALNIMCAGRFLFLLGMRPFSVLIGLLTFGLCWSNIETLGWSVQWSAVLSLTFFLVAAHAHHRIIFAEPKNLALLLALLSASCAASALCFSRGVLTGLSISAMATLALSCRQLSFWRWTQISIASLVPAFSVVAFILYFSSGNHQQLAAFEFAACIEMVRFSTAYILGAPLFHVIRYYDPFWTAVGVCGLIKWTVVAGVLLAVRKKRRLLWGLLFLLAFDFGNGCLLGIGRYHTGAPMALSWRYQYISLLCFGPFLGIAAEGLLNRISCWNRLLPMRLPLGFLFCSVWAGILAAPWKHEAAQWARWRGETGRSQLLENMPADKNATQIVPGIHWVTAGHAQQLIHHFNLH